MHPNFKTNLIPKFVLKLEILEKLQSSLDKAIPIKIEGGMNLEGAMIKISQAGKFKFAVPCFNNQLGLQMATKQIQEQLLSLGFKCQ